MTAYRLGVGPNPNPAKATKPASRSPRPPRPSTPSPGTPARGSRSCRSSSACSRSAATTGRRRWPRSRRTRSGWVSRRPAWWTTPPPSGCGSPGGALSSTCSCLRRPWCLRTQTRTRRTGSGSAGGVAAGAGTLGGPVLRLVRRARARPRPSSAVSRSPAIRRNLRAAAAVRSRTATSSWPASSVRGLAARRARRACRTASATASARVSALGVALGQRGRDLVGQAAHRDEPVLVGHRAVEGQPVHLVVVAARRPPRRPRSRPRTACCCSVKIVPSVCA